MTDRLRATLAMHFTKHIERGDWVSCLKALSGCAESGTTLQSLPYETLLPFLVTNGQWEAALRLSNECVAALSPTPIAGHSAKTSRAVQNEESRLCGTMMQVALTPEAIASPGSWQVAAAVVQRAARYRVRLPDETVQAALAATMLWQSTCDNSNDNGKNATLRRDTLQLMHDLLVADHRLRVSATKTGVISETHHHSSNVQSDIIDVLRTVLYSDDATNDSFTLLLHEQLRASFAVSWTSAVHTVLLACSGRVNELAYLAARPDVAEQTLHITLQCIFDGGVITPLPDNVLSCSTHSTGNAYTYGMSRSGDRASVPGVEARFGAAPRAFWRRVLEKDSAAELPKWEAVVDLALAALQLRERQWAAGNSSREATAVRSHKKYNEGEKDLVCQLAIAASLALAWPVSQSITSEWSPDRRQACVSRVTSSLRALLLHGAVAVAGFLPEMNGKRLECVVAESFVLLLQAYVRLCGTEMKGKDGGDSRADSLKSSSSSSSYALGSGLAAGRAVLWNVIFFPNESLEMTSAVDRTRCIAAWRSLLRHIFYSNPTLLRILFRPDENQSHPSNMISNSSVPSENESPSKRPNGRGRRRRPLPLGPVTLSADVINQLQCLLLFIAPGTPRGRGPLPGLTEVLTHKDDMGALGRGLIAASKRDSLSAGDVADVWRVYMESIPRHRVEPLLRNMMRAVEKEDSCAVARLALVTVMHEQGSDIFTLDEQSQCAEDFLCSAFPRTQAWRTALALFEQSPGAICQQHYNQQLEGEARGKHEQQKQKQQQQQQAQIQQVSANIVQKTERPTTARCVLNALVVDAAPPRWREALQVIEVLQHSAPGVAHTSHHHQACGDRAAWAPLTESERIDLYEALAPMRQHRQWRAALDLLDEYNISQRRLGPHDVACFAFAAATGPLSCARRLLSALGPHGKSRAVARAALVAAARHVKRIVIRHRQHVEKQQQQEEEKTEKEKEKTEEQEQEQYDETAIAQEHVLVLHEAADVAKRALECWEVPLADEEDFKFIVDKLRIVCAGDTHAARALFRHSTLLDSPQAKENLHALVREVSLCHATQDTASAVEAYQRFREHFDGMVAPTETMLQLMDLLVTTLTESNEKSNEKDGCSHLCMILQDTLFMYDVATEMIQRNAVDSEHSYISTSSSGETFLYRVYKTLFGLQAATSTLLVANPKTLTYAPQLICIFVEYLKQSSARLLRCLPEFVSVLSAILLSAENSTLSHLVDPIHTLTCHIQKLQDAMDHVVPLECVLPLRVFNKTLSGQQSDDERVISSKRSGGKWDPVVFVLENDALSTAAYQTLLNETVEGEVIAMYNVLVEEQKKRGFTDLDGHWQFCTSAIQTLRFVFQQRYGNSPPLAALILVISMALRYIRINPINNNTLNVDVRNKMIGTLLIMQELFDVFYTRLTAAHLAFAAMPNDGVSAAAAAVLKQMLYDAARHSCDFVHLITNSSRRVIQQMEHDALPDLEWIGQMVQLTAGAAGVCAVWEEASSLRESCIQELKQNAEALERLILKNNLNMDSTTVGTRLLLRVLYASFQGELDFVKETIEETSNCIQKNEFKSISDMFSKILTVAALLQTMNNKSSINGMPLLRIALKAYSQEIGKDSLENISDAQLCALVALKAASFGSAWIVQRAFGPFPEMLSCPFITGSFLLNSAEVEMAELFVYILVASSHHMTQKQRADPIDVMETVGSIAPHRWDLAWSLAKCLPLTTPPNEKMAHADPEAILRHRLTVALQCSGPWPPGMALALILETREENDTWRRDYPKLLEATTELDAAQCWRKLLPQPVPRGTESEEFVSRLQGQAARAASLLLGNSLVTKHGFNAMVSRTSRWQCIFDSIRTSDASVQFIAIAEMTSLDRFRDFLHQFAASLSTAAWGELSLGAQQLLLRSPHTLRHTLSLVASSRIVESSRKALTLNTQKSLQSLYQNDVPLLSFPMALFTTSQLVNNVDSNNFTFRRALRLFPAPQNTGTNVKEDLFFAESPCGFTSLQYAYAVLVETADERRFLLSLACSESMDEVSALLRSLVPKSIRVELLQAAWNVFLIRRTELSSSQGKSTTHRGGGRSALLPPTEETPPLSVMCAFFVLTSFSESKQAQQLMSEMIAHATNIGDGTPPITAARVEETLTSIMKSATHSIVHVDTAAVVSSAYSLLTKEVHDSDWLSLWPPLSLEMTRSRQYIKDFLRHAGKITTREGQRGNEQEKEKTNRMEVPYCSLRHPLVVSWVLQQQIILSMRVAPSRRPVIGLLNTLRSYVETGVAVFTPLFSNEKEQSMKRVFEKKPLFIRGSGAGIVVDVFLGLALKSWPLAGKAAERDRDTIRHVVDAIFPHHVQTHYADAVRNEAFLIGYIPVSRAGMQSLTSLLVLRDGLERRGTATAEHVVNLLRMEQQREAFRQTAAHDSGLPLARICIGQPRHDWDVQVSLLFFLRAFLATLTFVNPLGWHGERQSSLDRAYTALLDFMFLHAEEAGEATVLSRAVRSELERIFGPDALQVIYATEGMKKKKKKAVAQEEKKMTLSQLLSFFAGEWKGHSPSPQHNQIQKQINHLFTSPRTDSVDVVSVKDDPRKLTFFSNLHKQNSPVLSAVSLALDALRSCAIVPSAASVCRILDEAVHVTIQRVENSSEVARAVLCFCISVAPLTVVSTPTLERVLSLLVALQRPMDHPTDHQNATNDAKVTCDVLDLVLRLLQYISLATPSCVLLLCELYASFKAPAGTDQMESLREMILWRCAVESSRIPRAPLTVALHTLNESYAHCVRRGCLHFLLSDHSRPHYDPPFVQLGVALDMRLPCDEAFVVQLLRGLEGPDGSCVPWRRAAQLLHSFERNAYMCDSMDLDRTRLCLRVVLLERTLSTLKPSDALRRMWQQTLSELIAWICPSRPAQSLRCSAAKGLASSNVLPDATTECIPPSGAHEVNSKTDTMNINADTMNSKTDTMNINADTMNSKTDTMSSTNATFSGLHLIDATWMDRAAAAALRALHITQPREEWAAAFWLTRHVLNASLFSSSSNQTKCVWWSSEESVLFHTLQYVSNACDGSAIPLDESLSYMQLVATRQSTQQSVALSPIKRDRRAAVISVFTQKLSRHPYLRWTDAIALLKSLAALDAALAPPSLALRRAMDELVDTVMRRLYAQQSYEALLRFADAARQQHCPPRGREAIESLSYAASIVLASPSSALRGVLQMLLTDDPSSSLSSSSSSSSSALLSAETKTKTTKTETYGVSIDAMLREQSIAEREECARRLRDLLLMNQLTEAVAVARHTPLLMHTREFGDGCAGLLRRENARAIVRFFDALLHTTRPESEINKKARIRKGAALIDGIVEEDKEEPCAKGMGASAEKQEMRERREKGARLMAHVVPVALELALDAFAALANTLEGCGGTEARRAGLFVAAAYLRHILQHSKVDKDSHHNHNESNNNNHNSSSKNNKNNNKKESLVLTPRVGESLTVVLRVLARQVPVGDVTIISDAVDDALREAERERYAERSDLRFFDALQRIKPVARPLVQLLSGVFPDTAARLCDALLNSSLLLLSTSTSTTTTTTTTTTKGASDAEWMGFLRWAKAYNAAVLRADMHCRSILSDTTPQSDSRAALLRWRDRVLFSEGNAQNPENHWNAVDKECPSWVAALAAYRACRAFIGHLGLRGAHVARLSSLLTSSGSLCVAVRAARDVFIDSPLQSGDALCDTKEEQLGPSVGMESMFMLSDALQKMKKQCVQIISSWPGTNEDAVAILREVVMDLTDLNKFVMDGLAMITQQQQRVDYALVGGSELASYLIRCLTVTLSVDDWRASILRIIAALPPSQRHTDGVVLRDAVMESARDSFILHHALRQNPILPTHSADCRGLWREVYFIVSPFEKGHGKDTLLGGDMFAGVAADSARWHMAMTQVETLLSLASLAGDDNAVFSAMRFLSDAVLVRHAVPLTEEAKALVKVICIQSGGPKWRRLFEELTGFAPTTVRRPCVLPKDNETAQQRQLEISLNTVSNAAQGMQLMRDRRDVGVRLCHTHYQRLLQLLEQEHDHHEVEKENEVVSSCLTTRENSVKSRSIMELHFAMLQDGVSPSTQMAEQSLRLLSPHPLHVLQYAQALTLLPPVTNRRHKPQKHHLSKQHDEGNPNQDKRFTNDFYKKHSLALTEPMLRLVVEAAQKLPDALQQHKVTSDEAQEGLSMLAGFVRWTSKFSRVPCLERDVIENIVILLTTKPIALLNTQSCLSLSCDMRAELFHAIVASREAAVPHPVWQSCRGEPTIVDSLYFVSGRVCDGMTEHSALRNNAQSALRLVQQQASLHHVLRVEDSLLCRLFTALAEPDLTPVTLQPLTRLAQNAALISPKLREELAMNVAEQSVLWHIVRDCATHSSGEVQASTIVRAVSRAHALVRHEFSPPDATALSRLLALPSHVADENDDDNDSVDRPTAMERIAEGRNVKKSEEETALNSFSVMLRNAQPRSDLSVPFAVLMDRLCAAGQCPTACRFAALAAKGDEDIGNPHGIGHLLSQHVVVDCFLIWRLVEALHRHEQTMVTPLSDTQKKPSNFSLWALRLLEEQLGKQRERFITTENARFAGEERATNVLSISTLAVVKDIQKKMDSRFSMQKTLGGYTGDE